MFEYFARIVNQYPDCIDLLNISLPLVNGDIGPDRYHAHTGPGVFGVLRNVKILGLVKGFIGSEISSSPVQQMRIKPPLAKLGDDNINHSGVGNTSCHQDTVAVLSEANETRQLTV